MKRRDFIKVTGAGGTSLVLTPGLNMSLMKGNDTTININPDPLFDLSPWIYMQFMEPLGVTDSSVEAAWDHSTDRWRDDLIQLTKELAPGMIRWGGILSAYYHWREAVGPRDKRKPMLNILWGGMESNQIGTAEFLDLCKQVGADPLLNVNFESEGNPGYAVTKKGDLRSGNAKEAAEWVDYCNNPSNKERIKNNIKDPFPVKIWQIGNETSYSKNNFDNKTAAVKTLEFSNVMKSVDPSIKIVAWGDNGWTKQMIDVAGKNIDYIAFHHMFNPGSNLVESPVRDNVYRNDPAATWEILMNGYKIHEDKIAEMRNDVSPYKVPIALTECHYSFQGRNRCEVFSSWAAGVSYARMMNLHERNGDILKIATLADFCGTRWQNNAIMMHVPTQESFMMPVAKIMSLYSKHSGKQFLEVSGVQDGLDITASRTGNTFYLHVINTNRVRPVKTMLKVNGMSVKSGKAFELSTDPEFEIMRVANDPLKPKERVLSVNEPVDFPAASVTAVELIVSGNA
jgi:alpha-N-arabinofuranosidase